ncbi:MAG TPA: hypothetical protein VFY28_00215 [Candidatus Paceibacterota bacterium]|nr:hypothetical protein [Candidatus Paceibacterota bacterium]
MTAFIQEYPVPVYGVVVLAVAAFYASSAFAAMKAPQEDLESAKERLVVLLLVALAIAAAMTAFPALWHAGFAVALGAVAGIALGLLGSCFIKRDPRHVLRPTPEPPVFDPRR